MPTLELTLQRKTDSGYPVVAALTRPGGFLPLRREGMFNLDPAEFTRGRPDALTELQYDPLAYGTALGQALFVDNIRDTFREGLTGSEPLRVLLSIEAPDLRALDWHRLAAPCDGRWRFLASQQNTPFSLSIPSPASAHFPALGRRDLRALVLVAGPESLSGDYKLDSFDVAATTASVQAALGDIPCDVLDNPTLNALCDKLTATPYTLLHLVCHGAVNQNGETILYFPKDSKGGPTPATDLLDRLGSLARLPHFAFISACESALPQNGLGSLAGRLVRELGLPAVLAMTDRVSIATAGAIAAPFYAHLYQQGQPDLALAQSLAGLQDAHDLTVPAIFSRLGDRPLFDDNSERALTDKELEFGLAKLAQSLPERAPVMDSLRDTLTRRLRSTLGADSKSLSESSRAERKETLDQLNSLSLEVLDLSFPALCKDEPIPSYDSRSPFRGLESFRPEDADHFFGREALSRKLVQKLNEHNFLAVLGASGSGKSSLVMAGLIPALNVPYAVFRPGAEPLAELDKALQAGPQLLVVDQFEELFTLSAREQRSEFISRLLEQSKKIRVVITLRADFLGEVAPFKSLKEEVQNHQEIIPPMDEAELRRAMEGQAGCAGLHFESDLSQQMLDDVLGEPGAMPLLQHALWTLWTRRHGRWLRAEEYRAFGGVKQAIASTAEAVYARCSDFEKERLRDIFLRLTRLDESADGRDTRRRVLLRDLIPADSDPAATTLLIKQLADARLVVVTGDEVEVAHEALIRHWERLRAWLNDDRDNLRLREGVSDAAKAWSAAPTNADLLIHRGGRLDDVLTLSKNSYFKFTSSELAYLATCVEFRARERAERKKRQLHDIESLQKIANEQLQRANIESRASRRARKFIMGLTVLIVLIIGALVASLQLFQIADARRVTVLGRNALAEKDPFNAIILALQAQKLADVIEARDLLDDATNAIDVLGKILRGHKDFVSSVAWSADGRLASGSYDGTVIIWNLTSSQPSQIMHGHKGGVTSVAWSPNGQLASGSADKTVIIWDLVKGQPAQILHEHTEPVTSVAWSPDGRLASSSADKTIIIWNLTSGQPAQIMRGHTGGVTSVAWSKDGRLASGSADKTVIIWNLANSQPTQILRGHTNDVASVAWSPDGGLASASFRSETIIWDTTSGQPLKTISEQGFEVISVAWSLDGQLALGGWDEQHPLGISKVIIWDVDRGQPSQTLRGKMRISGSLAWSTDGRLAAGTYDFSRSSGDNLFSSSKSEDNFTITIWDFVGGVPIRILNGHFTSVISVAWSPSGQLASGAMGNADNSSPLESAIIWNLNTRVPAPTKLGQTEGVYSVAWSPDGRLALGTSNGKIVIWDIVSGTPTKTLSVYDHDERMAGITSIAWSRDGRLASGSYDGTVIVWDLDSGKPVQILRGHWGFVNSVAWSPTGQLASGNGGSYLQPRLSDEDYNVIVWDLLTGKPAKILRGHKDSIRCVSWSAKGRLASASTDGKIIIWDLSSSRASQILNGNEGGANSVAWSTDGRLASGYSNGKIIIWDLTNSRPIRIINKYSSAVTSLAWSSDGRLASGSLDGKVKVFASKLTNQPCDLALRNLLVDEWVSVFGVIRTYQPTCPNLWVEDIQFPSLIDWKLAILTPEMLIYNNQLGHISTIDEQGYFLPTRFIWLTWPGRLLALGGVLLVLGLLWLVLWLPFTDSNLIKVIVLGCGIGLAWIGYEVSAHTGVIVYWMIASGLVVLSLGLTGTFFRLLFKRAGLVKIALAFGFALSPVLVLVGLFVFQNETANYIFTAGLVAFWVSLTGLALHLLLLGIQWALRRVRTNSR